MDLGAQNPKRRQLCAKWGCLAGLVAGACAFDPRQTAEEKNRARPTGKDRQARSSPVLHSFIGDVVVMDVFCCQLVPCGAEKGLARMVPVVPVVPVQRRNFSRPPPFGSVVGPDEREQGSDIGPTVFRAYAVWLRPGTLSARY